MATAKVAIAPGAVGVNVPAAPWPNAIPMGTTAAKKNCKNHFSRHDDLRNSQYLRGPQSRNLQNNSLLPYKSKKTDNRLASSKVPVDAPEV